MEQIACYVYTTNDYSLFKSLSGNRFVDHSEQIIDSINNNGQLFSPIIVNENFAIIDGQNRFEAYKKLGLPVNYIIVNGYGINECIAMNCVSKNWTILDYIKCYAELGNSNYIILREIIKKYPKIPNKLLISISGGNMDNFVFKPIREGKFTLGEKYDFEFLDNIFSYLSKFDISYIKGNATMLYKIIAFCFLSSQIDHHKLLEFYDKYYYIIDPIVNTKQASENIEKVYNYRCSKKNYVPISELYQKFIANAKRKSLRENTKQRSAKRSD